MKPIAAFLVLLLAALPCRAQPAPDAKVTADVVTYFYKDPRPERLVGHFERYERTASDWAAFPPLVGFYAVVFRGRPDWIDRLIPAKPGPSGSETLRAALQLAGLGVARRDLQARFAPAAGEPTLKAQLAGLPDQIDNLVVKTPTHLDILWGASFASGDGRYPRKVIGFLEKTANRSHETAIDILKLAAAMRGPDRKLVAEMKAKYDDATLIQLVYAATATWGLSSNAQQHPFVDREVAEYVAANPQTPTGKLLDAVHKK
jgi:hypothetical protein